MSPRSTSSKNNSRTANMSMRNHERWRSRARRASMKWRVSAEWAETCKHERSRTRPVDAGAYRRRHHDGFCHGLHADGPRHVLRLHRVLRPVAELGAEPCVRPDGPAHLWRDDQRRPDLDPAVRADWLRDGTRRDGRQDVLFDRARVAPV